MRSGRDARARGHVWTEPHSGEGGGREGVHGRGGFLRFDANALERVGRGAGPDGEGGLMGSYFRKERIS